MVRSLLSMSYLNRRRAFRCVALIREVSTEGADEQVRQREPSPGERHKRRKRGERDDQDRDHGEGADQEEKRRPQKDWSGDPFEPITHDSTTFLVRGDWS
jgi:hypothetical protein